MDFSTVRKDRIILSIRESGHTLIEESTSGVSKWPLDISQSTIIVAIQNQLKSIVSSNEVVTTSETTSIPGVH